ncbi:MAG: DUF6132 family protein [Bacteroidia bacterium]
MKTIKKHRLTLLGLGFGAIAGYLYYYFWGCASGTCAITSNPINSTLYGSIMGSLLLNLFQPNNTENN